MAIAGRGEDILKSLGEFQTGLRSVLKHIKHLNKGDFDGVIASHGFDDAIFCLLYTSDAADE